MLIIKFTLQSAASSLTLSLNLGCHGQNFGFDMKTLLIIVEFKVHETEQLMAIPKELRGLGKVA